MSSIPGLTAQVNNMSGCAPADCCAEIAAIKSQLSTINAEIAALKAKNPKDHTQDIAKLFALLGTLQIGITSLGAEVGILGAATATASAIAAGAASAVGLIAAQLAAMQAAIAGLLASLAALSAAILPLIGLAAIVATLALNAAAAQILAQSAYGLADTALKIGSSAGDQAATAILRAKDALSAAISAGQSAQDAKQAASTADTRAIAAGSAASAADNKAVAAGNAASAADNKAVAAAGAAATAKAEALAAAGAANAKAEQAIGTAGAANTKAEQAVATAGAINTKVEQAIGTAGAANTKADKAISSAGAANTKAEQAVATAGAINTKVEQAIGTAGAANTKADKAIGTAGAANTKAEQAIGTAGVAQATANTAVAGTGQAISTSGQALNTSGIADNKSTEALDKANTALNKTLTNNPAPPIIYPIQPAQPVTPSKENEILDLLKSAKADVLGIPGALAASTQYRAAAISAAAAGACQSSQPGKCPGGSADQNNQLKGIMDGISAAVGLLNNAVLGTITSTLNVINTKLGSQIVGGLSAWSKGIAEVVNKSQILNVLTYISVLHNAYMLSNALSQTLFSAVGNSLAALGLKDTSVDPAGTPFNVGKIVGDWTETFFKSVFGVATVNGIKADWKKYSRIYQAAAQVVYSVQSIGHSILGALEVVGSHISKIGNALQKFRVVSDKAYSWMNPTPSFQNRFMTGLQQTQEVVSQIDQVSSEVLSVQENITQMGKLKEELDKSLKQEPDSKQAAATPEAVKVKEAAAEAKTASKSPLIPDESIPKPD